MRADQRSYLHHDAINCKVCVWRYRVGSLWALWWYICFGRSKDTKLPSTMDPRIHFVALALLWLRLQQQQQQQLQSQYVRLVWCHQMNNVFMVRLILRHRQEYDVNPAFGLIVRTETTSCGRTKDSVLSPDRGFTSVNLVRTIWKVWKSGPNEEGGKTPLFSLCLDHCVGLNDDFNYSYYFSVLRQG